MLLGKNILLKIEKILTQHQSLKNVMIRDADDV